MRRVLVADSPSGSLDIEKEILAAAGAEPVPASGESEDGLVADAPGAVAIMTNWRPVTARVLEAATECRLVVRYGVGLDNVDVACATQLGMVVTNVPDYCIDEVPEHALALILGLRRNIVVLAEDVANGGWDQSIGAPLHRVAGQTLGLVGAGRLARALAWRAHGLGLKVLAYSRSSTPGAVHDGIEFADSLEDLLERSDIVSVHVPLTDETRHLIGRPQLARMKPSAILINTARGAVVDTAALVEALESGRIAGAGLDVMPSEPPDPDDALLHMENVIVTPHAAAFSAEATEYVRRRAATAARDLLLGKMPAEIVNPQVLLSERLRAASLRS